MLAPICFPKTSTADAGFEGFFDGTLGCPTIGADQAEGCYGSQPVYAMRLSVISVGNTTLLAGARMSNANPDETFFAMFEGDAQKRPIPLMSAPRTSSPPSELRN